jgi:hypothetical protein
MRCAFCEDKIHGKPIRQAGQNYCSLECANLASGAHLDDDDAFFEEESVGGYDDDDDN